MTSLASISAKVDAGIRLSEEDALFLFHSPDLFAIGALADRVNRRKNGSLVYYNVNRHVNPTNICAMSCKFCAYSRKPGEEGGYEYSVEEILDKVGAAAKQGAREIHMVGGLHPRWRLSHFTNILTSVKAKFPDIHLKGFTAVEIDWLARRSRMSITELLVTLKEAGLDSMPGGGAEIFHQDVRDAITAKLTTDEWIDVHRTAHGLGMHSNCTMLYGHVEEYWHRVDHMSHLRMLQDETGGFNAFIPLSFQPHNNEMGISRYTFGADDLKTIAVARLFLDNFQHIKAYWIMLGQDIAQLALNFGANDIDGTVTEEKISNMAGSQGGMSMSKEQIEDLILRTHHNVCERDTLYHQVSPVKMAGTDHSQPAFDIETAVARLEESAHLPKAEYLTLATGASFHQLTAMAKRLSAFRFGDQDRTFTPALVCSINEVANERLPAEAIKQALMAEPFLSLGSPASVVFEMGERSLGDTDNGSIAAVSEWICDLKTELPKTRIIYAGIKRILDHGKNLDQSIERVILDLKLAGIDLIIPSPLDTEWALPLSEVIEFHRTAHGLGMATSCKVELRIESKTGTPLWAEFIERLMAFDHLQAQTLAFDSLIIEPDQESKVTMSEFSEAVAVARLVSKNFRQISTPLTSLPIVRKPPQDRGLWDASALKVGALPLLVGASDLGYLDPRQVDCGELAANALSAGCILKTRGRHCQNDSDRVLQLISGSLRHVPEVLRSQSQLL